MYIKSLLHLQYNNREASEIKNGLMLFMVRDMNWQLLYADLFATQFTVANLQFCIFLSSEIEVHQLIQQKAATSYTRIFNYTTDTCLLPSSTCCFAHTGTI